MSLKEAFVTPEEICDLVGINPETLRIWDPRRGFPAAIYLTRKSKVYERRAVVLWIASRAGAAVENVEGEAA